MPADPLPNLPWLPPRDEPAWSADLHDLRTHITRLTAVANAPPSDPPAPPAPTPPSSQTGQAPGSYPATTAWTLLQRLATTRLGPLETTRLDRELTRLLAAAPAPPTLEPVRLALLSSSTTRHLLPALRLAGLRRGLLFTLYDAPYGQYLQQTLASPDLLAFHPDLVLFALDAHHLADLALADLTQSGQPGLHARLELLWRTARERLGATVVQQTALPLDDDLLGSNEHRLPDSAAAQILALNTWLRSGPAEAAGVHLLALDRAVLAAGLDSWHDPALWHLAKQEVHPNAAPLWADLVARLAAAVRGRSRKCLVLDLDNTLWHGVVGDDGPTGIEVGQGSALAEAHLALHTFAASLRRRGILLAVCSKNDDAVARAAFAAHPHLPLQLASFASFRANWQDKATNLRSIAHELNLPLDALVFADDNPAERALIRRELPAVAVPELGSDPSRYVQILSRAGYFEALDLLPDDRRRADHYAARAASTPPPACTDLRDFLAGLGMHATAVPFSEPNLPRIVQLSNKTNQFNLTGLRLTPDLVRTWITHESAAHPTTITLQLTLADRFGDHGTVALLAAHLTPGPASAPTPVLEILLWVMSCRVFGRELEHLCRNQLLLAARRLGATSILAPLTPTPKNALLRDRLADLGFSPPPTAATPELWQLPVTAEPLPSAVALEPDPTPALVS